MIDLIVVSDGFLSWPGGKVRAAIGKGGLSTAKRECDGATPVGNFPLRCLWYRSDRLPRPKTALPIFEITGDRGWSDDPADPRYNQAVTLPHAAGHERLWRDDGLYDLIVPLGYNDDPPVAGLGSAIFLHVAKADYAPTEGCVALALPDLIALLTECGPRTRIAISET